MPRLELDLSEINTLRGELERMAGEQRTLDVQLAQKVAQARALQRSNAASASQLAALQAELAQLRTQRGAARQRADTLQRTLAEHIGRLEQWRHRQGPEAMAEALDGSQPIAMFPVRLETRYVTDANASTALRVRIYPDTLHVVHHAEGLTDAEREAGTALWQARFARQGEAQAQRDLVQALGRGRARWVERALTPLNAAQAGEPGARPQFPEVPTIDARAKATHARLLPVRWCAIGYAAEPKLGMQVEVFRVWGRHIPDTLPMSPDWESLKEHAEGLVDGERRWMVDFDAALARGMALQVTQQNVTVPWFQLATHTLVRLLVVGLDWSRDATQTAAEVGALLAAQRDSQGLGFVPPGTPTNNTEAAPSGYSPSAERAAPTDTAQSAAPLQSDALQLLCHALGIAEDSIGADGIAGADLRDQRTALHMMNVLWRGTIGNYLMSLWNLEDASERQMHIRPATLYALREYAIAYVRPAGALPVLRVGKQPYGVLPVVGSAYTEAGATAAELGISRLLAFLRPMWELARAQVPLLRTGDMDKAKDMLQTAPWSQVAYYRDEAVGGASYYTTPQGTQPNMLARRIFQHYGAANFDSTPIATRLFLADPPHRAKQLAGVPWVLADAALPTREAAPDSPLPAGAGNYLARMAEVLGGPARTADLLLKQFQSGPALLQSLAAFSVDLERHDAAERFAVESVLVEKATSQWAAQTAHVERPEPTATGVELHTPQQLEQLVLPDVTGIQTLGEYVMQSLAPGRPDTAGAEPVRGPRTESVPILALPQDLLTGSVRDLRPQVRSVAAVKSSLAELATRPVGELNIALRGTLDVFSYRLDAWYTARASRRLALVRGRQPGGLYVGGFGWVEQLRPNVRPASEGHILAPSLAQAATAAILRSGAIANRSGGAATNQDGDAFQIQLDSHRTRRAQEILQGLTQDQPLAALYGYRIERALRDAQLGRLIWPLRLAYPWRPAGTGPGDEPAEAVAARDVVDGVALLAAWQEGNNEARLYLSGIQVNGTRPFLGLLRTDPPNAAGGLQSAEREAFEHALQDAIGLADAVADLLMAEGVHQIVQGNFERAGAAMGIVDKQSRPIAPEVARTPRSGVAYTQRFAVLCPLDTASAWPSDRRARAEPALEAWLAHMLGAPSRWRIAARVHRGDAMDAQPLVLGLQALGWSALSVVLGATVLAGAAQAHHGDTGLRARLLQVLSQQLADAASVTGLDILPDGDASGAPGLGALEALCTTLRAVLDHMHPATRKDLAVPQDSIEQLLPDQGEYPGVDLAELQARAAHLRTDFIAAKDALAASTGADALLAQLAAFEDFLPAASWPPQVAAIDAPQSDPSTRAARADAARAALAALLQARLHELDPPPPADDAPPPTHGQQVQRALDQIRLLLGRGFPVLPRFTLGGYAAAFNDALAAQDALTLNDPWQVTGWMTGMARVREGLDRFAGALAAHETLVDFSAPGDFQVVQYPHVPGRAWAALPQAWTQAEGIVADLQKVPEELRDFIAGEGTAFQQFGRDQPRPSLALALHTPGGRAPVQADTPLAGFVCDEWPETVPDRFQTAGIAFHHDAPGARPPQSVLLAVPPHAEQAHWEFDQVVDTVHEAFSLARLRAVRPRDLGSGLGELLPANRLPQNLTDALPSVRWLDLTQKAWVNLQASHLGMAQQASGVVPLGKI